jgi:hypothetical protein
MAERARVTSVEALESFRASLILYLSQARPALEEAVDEVARMRQWLENDRRPYWDNELRRRLRKLEEAEQALFSARLSTFQEETAAQTLAVRRAKSAVDDAEWKRNRVRQWARDFENRTDPMARQIDMTQGFLTTEMGRAVAHLARVIETLEAYAGLSSPAAGKPGEAVGGDALSSGTRVGEEKGGEGEQGGAR